MAELGVPVGREAIGQAGERRGVVTAKDGQCEEIRSKGRQRP